jgi:hypothetical protein
MHVHRTLCEVPPNALTRQNICVADASFTCKPQALVDDTKRGAVTSFGGQACLSGDQLMLRSWVVCR